MPATPTSLRGENDYIRGSKNPKWQSSDTEYGPGLNIDSASVDSLEYESSRLHTNLFWCVVSELGFSLLAAVAWIHLAQYGQKSFAITGSDTWLLLPMALAVTDWLIVIASQRSEVPGLYLTAIRVLAIIGILLVVILSWIGVLQLQSTVYMTLGNVVARYTMYISLLIVVLFQPFVFLCLMRRRRELTDLHLTPIHSNSYDQWATTGRGQATSQHSLELSDLSDSSASSNV